VISQKPAIAWVVTGLVCLWVLHANVSPDFTPVRSELANAHGFSRGLLNFVVLSAEASFRHAPRWAFVLCAGLFLVLGRRGVVPLPAATAATVHNGARSANIAGGAAAALLAAVALSPYVSPYRVVLAPRTFVLCVLLIVGPRGVRAMRPFLPAWTPVATGVAAAVFIASAVLHTLPAYQGNYSGFLHISRDVAGAAPFLRERPELARSLLLSEGGYDGQFMYLMAFDPFLRRFADRPQEYQAFIDAPPYRYGRIGFSVLTRVAAIGQPEWYPATMIWLIVSAHFALAVLLGSIAVRHGVQPIAALSYLAIPGFMSSLMSALPEALAAAALVAGVVSWQRRRPWLAAAAFAAALLIRETAVVLIVVLALADGRSWKRSALVLLGALLPVAAWRLYVGTRLYAEFGLAALVTNPGDLGVPFGGLARLVHAALTGAQPSPEVAGAVVFPAILTAALVLSASLAFTRRGPFEIAAVVYAAVAVSLNYEKIWVHLPSGERGTFELFLCLLLVWLQGSGQPAWARRALAALFAALALYTFLIAPDAGTSRAALLLIR
jgi:hypothetical protein